MQISNPGTPRPKLSFGLPVRNGGQGIVQTIDSVLAQTYRDFELVICDNGSTDGTLDLVRRYAERDPRVKLFINEKNIGQSPNFNRVFEKSTGEYFRWIGVDDTIAPTYAQKCVAVLNEHPECIAVSEDTRFVDDAGNILFAPYHGERTESPRPERRFWRTMWFYLADYRYFDPIYNMMRRDILARTGLVQSGPLPDQEMTAKIALLGPAYHIPECLSTRQREPSYFDNMPELAKKWNPDNPDILLSGPWTAVRHFNRIAWLADLSLYQKLVCTAAALIYGLKRTARQTRGRLFDALRVLMPGSLHKRLKAMLGRA